jgi:hypothetical protein
MVFKNIFTYSDEFINEIEKLVLAVGSRRIRPVPLRLLSLVYYFIRIICEKGLGYRSKAAEVADFSPIWRILVWRVRRLTKRYLKVFFSDTLTLTKRRLSAMRKE